MMLAEGERIFSTPEGLHNHSKNPPKYYFFRAIHLYATPPGLLITLQIPG